MMIKKVYIPPEENPRIVTLSGFTENGSRPYHGAGPRTSLVRCCIVLNNAIPSSDRV